MALAWGESAYRSLTSGAGAMLLRIVAGALARGLRLPPGQRDPASVLGCRTGAGTRPGQAQRKARHRGGHGPLPPGPGVLPFFIHGRDMKAASRHWIVQRLTAIALIPLAIWFLVSLLLLPDLHYATARAWVALPLNAVLLGLMIVVAVLALPAGCPGRGRGLRPSSRRPRRHAAVVDIPAYPVRQPPRCCSIVKIAGVS